MWASERNLTSAMLRTAVFSRRPVCRASRLIGSRGVRRVRGLRVPRASTYRATSDACEGHGTMAEPPHTTFNRALDNIGKHKGPGDFREQAGTSRQAMSPHERKILDVFVRESLLPGT